MKRIGNSKEPTEKIIRNILSNLGEKFPNATFSIEAEAWYHKGKVDQVEYSLWAGDRENFIIRDELWSEFLTAYRKVVKDA